MEIQSKEPVIFDSVPVQTGPQKVDFLTKIIQNQKSNPLFEEATTILEVTNETIETQLKLTPESPNYNTALFGSLLKSLQLSANRHTYDHIGAIILLFQYTFQKVDHATKQKTAGVIEKSLETILKDVPKNTIPDKYIISMYANIIQYKPPAEWKKESTRKMFNFILEAIDGDKITTRKKASKCLTALVQHGLFKIPDLDFELQKYFINYIKEGNINPKPATFILFFLNNALKFFPTRAACEIAREFMNALKHEDVNIEFATHIYSTLESLLAAKPLPGEVVEGFIKELLNNPPDLREDTNINFAYLQCLAQAILHLHSVNPKSCKNYISPAISSCTEYLLSSNQKLASLACKSIELVINHTVSKALWVFANDEEDLFGLDDLGIEEGNNAPNAFQRIVINLRYLLNPQFSHVLKYVSSIFATFFDRLDPTCPEAAYELINEWIKIKDERNTNHWASVVGKFIQKVNLEFILKTYPLRIFEADLYSDTYEQDSHSWILPVLRKYLRIDSIQLFLEHLLPVMSSLDDFLYTKDQFGEVEKTLEFVYVQIWAIFPKFCKFTKENIPFIEQIFDITTKVITNRPNVRKDVCQGLEVLCSYFFKLPKYANQKFIQAQEMLTASANKLMPKLCAMYMKEAASSKDIIKLIRTMAGLCSKQYLETVFLKHIQKLTGNQMNKFTLLHSKECDILIAMANSIDLATHYELAKNFVDTFLADKANFQKRAFKLLEILAKKVHASFLPELFEVVEKTKLVQSSSKYGKLSCILTFLEKMEYTADGMEDVIRIVQRFLPEVLVALKETNRKTRKVAIGILKFLTSKFQEHEAAQLFLSLVTAGLAAKTSLMKSVAIMGMSHVIKEGQEGFETAFVWETTSIVLLMLKEKNREIYKAVIQFLKIYLKVTPKAEVERNLQNILVPLFEWDDDGKDQNKLALRHLIEKFVRKLGKKTVEESMPGDHGKLIKYIAKQETLAKKKKEVKRNEYKKQMESLFEDKRNKVGRTLEEEDNDDFEAAQAQIETGNAMETETNNLLLKFDTMKEKFHFVEHPIARIKAKQKKEEEVAKKHNDDVFFNESTGKIVIAEDITGKKRRPDAFADAMLIEEENRDEAQQRTIRKVVRISKDKTVVKQAPQEEQKTADGPEKKRSLINRKIIGDVKIFNSETLNPTAYIPINPKILNKRNRANASKAFDFLLSTKKTGSLAGLKSRTKS